MVPMLYRRGKAAARARTPEPVDEDLAAQESEAPEADSMPHPRRPPRKRRRTRCGGHHEEPDSSWLALLCNQSHSNKYHWQCRNMHVRTGWLTHSQIHGFLVQSRPQQQHIQIAFVIS